MSQEPMTQERLNDIRARADGATSGPWGCYGDGAHEVFDAGEYSDGDPGEVVAAVIDKLSDAVFIAEAREDIPALLAEVRRLRGELAKAREVTDEKVTKAVYGSMELNCELRLQENMTTTWCEMHDSEVDADDRCFHVRGIVEPALTAVLEGEHQ